MGTVVAKVAQYENIRIYNHIIHFILGRIHIMKNVIRAVGGE